MATVRVARTCGHDVGHDGGGADGGSGRANIYAAFNRNVVGVGTLDGRPVRGVSAPDRCTAVFTTSTGTTLIDFRLVKPPFAARGEAQQDVTQLPDRAGRLHRFAAPSAKARPLQLALSFSYDQCRLHPNAP